MITNAWIVVAMLIGQSAAGGTSAPQGADTGPTLRPLSPPAASATDAARPRALPPMSAAQTAVAQLPKTDASAPAPKNAAAAKTSTVPKGKTATVPKGKSATPRPPLLEPDLPKSTVKPSTTKTVPRAEGKSKAAAAPKSSTGAEKKETPPPADASTDDAPKDKAEGDAAKDEAKPEDKPAGGEASEPKPPITAQMDIPYRSPSICVFDPWETAEWSLKYRNLFYWRSGASDRPAVLSSTGAEVADTGAFDLGNSWGQDVSLGRWFDTAQGAELNFTWLSDANSDVIITGAGDFRLPFFGPNSVVFQNLVKLDARLRSTFWGTEANYLYNFRDGTDHCLRFTGLIGFRQVTFEETLQFSTLNIVNFGSTYSNRMSNGLYGGQLGGKVTYRELLPNLNMDGYFKFGLMGNVIEGRTALTGINLNTGGSVLLQGEALRTTRFAQLVDTGFEFVYKWREEVHFTLGYQLIYIHKLARGTGQLEANLAQNRPFIRAGDDIFIQGINFGVRLFWGHRADPYCGNGCCTPYVMLTDCSCQN